MRALKMVSTLILLSMLAVTTVSSLDRGVFEAGAELGDLRRSAAAPGWRVVIDQIMGLAWPGLAVALGLTSVVWLASVLKRDPSIVDTF